MRWAAAVVVAVGVAVALWLLRSPAPVPPQAAPEPERVLAHADAVPAPLPTPASAESPANARLAELRAMSDSVLRSTFVVAIRSAGFLCEDVVGVDQGEAGAPVWRARCPDLRAYLVGVNDAGGLSVEPTLDHWDAVAPAVMPVVPPRNPLDLLGPRDPRR